MERIETALADLTKSLVNSFTKRLLSDQFNRSNTSDLVTLDCVCEKIERTRKDFLADSDKKLLGVRKTVKGGDTVH